MHIEAEDSRTESRQQIRDEHTTRTYQMFQPDTYIYKGVHIHQQMESADMHKVASHGTPPVTGQVSGPKSAPQFSKASVEGSKIPAPVAAISMKTRILMSIRTGVAMNPFRG